jgi:hypothetical protein
VIVIHQLPQPPEIAGIALVAAGVAPRAEPAEAAGSTVRSDRDGRRLVARNPPGA